MQDRRRLPDDIRRQHQDGDKTFHQWVSEIHDGCTELVALWDRWFVLPGETCAQEWKNEVGIWKNTTELVVESTEDRQV
jgi:hypothetical protein